MRMKSALIVLMAMAFYLSTAEANATEGIPEIRLDMRPPQDTFLRDGTVIGHGWLAFQEVHTGYQVWLDASRSSAAPGRYVLVGKRNSAHQLRIRLAGEGWESENEGEGGIVSATTDERTRFDIVIDGHQDVAADEYVITASAAAIVP